jgi:ADP-heptose:LPS heptosyltransferase
MTKSPLISYALTSMYGDLICRLPFLNYLEKRFPNSYKSVYIDPKCSQIAPFLLNHPLIDNIYISDKDDIITEQDKDYFRRFDLAFHPYPQVTRPDYYNHWGVLEENLRMATLINGGRINPAELSLLTPEEKYPKLTQWFNIEKQEKTIAVLPFSGYNNDPSIQKRSPSKEWWLELVKKLRDKGYRINQYGSPKSELLDHAAVFDRRKLGLFDMVKEVLSCELSISTDSGSAWILGAYGTKQVIIYSNYLNDHHTNTDAFKPLNCKGNAHYVFGANGINGIPQEEILKLI